MIPDTRRDGGGWPWFVGSLSALNSNFGKRDARKRVGPVQIGCPKSSTTNNSRLVGPSGRDRAPSDPTSKRKKAGAHGIKESRIIIYQIGSRRVLYCVSHQVLSLIAIFLSLALSFGKQYWIASRASFFDDDSISRINFIQGHTLLTFAGCMRTA
jgi:hypothetical protein